MRILTSLAIALVLISTVAGSPASKTAVKDRILRAVDPTQVAVVKGTAHPLARTQMDLGRTDTSRTIRGSITFRLSAAQQSDLDQLLREQQDPSSANYHRWITPEQYAERFGMSANDLAKVSTWLQSQGLHVESVSRSRNEIAFSGSAGEVEYAFKTELHNYMIRGEKHFANAREVSLPAAFSAQVLNVRGLNDIRPRARIRPLPRFTSNISGNHFIIPGDFNTIYDIPSTATGAGQKIAVVGQTNISNTDIDAFRSAAGLAAKDPTVVLVPNSGLLTTFPSDEVEADLDAEWSGAIAPAASIIFVTVGDDLSTSVFDALTYAVDQNLAPVISISYGNCESGLQTSFITSLQQAGQQANAQGQTIVGPSGDSGGADCDSGASATGGYQVDVPASIPEVTGVGGTEFTGDTAGAVSGSCASANTYWSGSCSQTSGASALSYIPETAWNDTSQGGGLSATGGGASTVFAKPSWQSGTGVPADGKRDVPDIALNGSNFHDPYLVCSQAFYSTQNPPSSATSCASGFRASDTSLAAVGGTSVGAPTFAAIMALINQATGSAGQGNANATLYRLAASTPSAFHDITSGDNKVPCSAGSTNCPQGTASIGFSAGAGYDLTTGLGSVDVAKLITAWTAAKPGADFTIEGQIASISAPGGTANSTVSVISMGGFAGTVNLTCTGVSGAAQVGCTINPTSVNLTAGSTATATVNITTVAALSKPARHSGAWFAATGGLFAAVILGGIPSKRRWLALLGLFLGVLITVGVACGGGSSNNNQQQKSQGTPVGTYVITVTGTSGSTSHSATISVAVQ